MAAQKSIASSVSRKTKAKAAQSTPAVISKPKRLTSKEPYGVMIGDRLAAATAEIDGGLESMKKADRGAYLVHLCCNDEESRDAERASERRKMRRNTNPLAAKLAEEHSYVLYAVGEELGDVAALHEPSGRVVRPLGDGRRKRDGAIRRATDAEAVLSELYVSDRFMIDVRNDVPGQVVKKLTAYIKRLQATVDRVKLAKKRGIFVPLTDEERAEDEAAEATPGKAVK